MLTFKAMHINQARNLCACGLADGIMWYFEKDRPASSRYVYSGNGVFDLLRIGIFERRNWTAKDFGVESIWLPYKKEDACLI